MNTRIVVYLIFLLLLVGCGEKHDPVFDQLEERVSDNPDSVCTVLEEMDVAVIPSEFDRSRHAMLLMMARHKCRQDLQPDSNLYKAAKYFHKKKDLLNEAKARYYAGVAECEVGNNQGAIREALQAIDRSHEAADTFWMGRAHDLAHEIYMNTYDCKNAAIEADKAAVYFKRAGATPFHRYALVEKAQALNYPVYEDGSPTGRGMALLDSLKKVALSDRDSAIVADCLYHQSIYSYDSKNYNLAELQIDSIRQYSNTTALIDNLLPNIISIQITKGLVPHHLFEEYRNQLSTPNDTLSYFNLKSKTAVAHGDWKEAYLLLDSMRNYFAIIMADKTFRSVEEIKDIHNKKIIDEQKKQNSHLRFTQSFISCLAIGISISFLLVFLIIGMRNRQRERETMEKLLDIASENDNLKEQIGVQDKVMAENNLLKERVKEQSKIIELQDDLKTKLSNFERMVTDYDSLKKQFKAREAEYQQVQINLNQNLSSNVQELTIKKATLLGNRIDTLCNLAMEYYDVDDSKTSKNIIYNRVVKELKQLKSESYLRELERKINELHNGILERFKNQLPEIAKENTRWIALMIGGLSPQTISFLLDMKIQTFYTKRLRVRSYIEKSNTPDKNEFLLYFPKAKK